jgi:hypothetical protein
MILFEKKNKYGSFDDLMGVSIETDNKWLDKKLNVNVCHIKTGGGGSAPQDVPKTLQPYVTQILDRAKGLYGSYLPQQLYQGERIMGFTPTEQAAQAGVAGMVERGISGDPALTSAGTYYQPALGLLGAGAQQQQAASGLLGAIAPTLGASGAQFGRAARTLGGVAPALQQYQQRVGGAEQTLAGVSPELQAYRQRLSGAEAMLGATAPTLSQYEQQLQQAAQTYGGAQQQLGRAEEAARAGTGSVGIGELDTARYMSPYQQQVIDIEKRQAMQDAAQVAQAIGAKAAGMGAFGGSRQAILEGQAASDLGTRLADIQTRGSQAAYDRALQTAAQQQQLQYGEDVAALGRQSTLGQALAGLAGAQTGIGQQQAGLGISGYGGLAGAGRETAAQLAGLGGQYGNIGQQVGALAGQQAQLGGLYGDIGQQLGSLAGQQVGVGQAVGQLAGQYGAGAGAMAQQASGLAGLSQAFGNLGQQALGQGYREQGYLAGVGEQERGLQQQRADLAYQQFVEQRDYPDVQLQKFSSLIQGFPFQGFSQTPQQPSGFQQAIGAATAIGGLGRGLNFFNKGGKINGNREGGLSTIYAATAGQIQDLINQKKEIEDEINRRNAARKTPSGQYSLQRKIDDIDEQLASFSQNVPTEPAQRPRTVGRPSPVRNASGQQQLLSPAPPTKTSASSSQQPASTQANPAAQAAQDLVQTVSGPNYPGTLANLASQYSGGVPITELQTRAMKSYGALEALLDKDKFDAEARRKEIEEQIAAERSQGGFDLAALGVEIMSKPLDKIDTDLIRNLGTSKKEVGKLKSMLEKLPAEERAYALRNELTKLTSLGTIQDLIPDSLEAPSATPAVIQSAVELASRGMSKSFSQNQLENAGIKIGELALEVQSDIDTLQIKDDNVRDLAFQTALAEKIRNEIKDKKMDAGNVPETGDQPQQGNQMDFINPPKAS